MHIISEVQPDIDRKLTISHSHGYSRLHSRLGVTIMGKLPQYFVAMFSKVKVEESSYNLVE